MDDFKKYYETASPDRYTLLKENATAMRKSPTDGELVMWQILKKYYPSYHFRRQHIIGDYIVDFACLKERLVIEVDGEYHNAEEQRHHDEWRTNLLNRHNFRVIRVTNEDVIHDVDKVIEIIDNSLKVGSINYHRKKT